MPRLRLKKNVRDNMARRTAVRVLNFMFLRRSALFVVAGAAALLAAAVVLIVIFTGGASAKTVSNADPVPTVSDAYVPTETPPAPTPTPEPIPTTTPTPDPTLKFGDVSEEVERLQKRLMDLGYLDIDEPTQKFGPATKAAVQWFQREAILLDHANLEQTGIADAETLAWIYSDSARPYTLLEGTRGSDVDSLQSKLIELGYLNKAKATGYYGTETIAAVKDFQKRNKLDVDGKTGDETLNKIYSPDAVPSASKIIEKRRQANIEKMISVAEAQLGKPYVGGAEGPNSFDCSGLVYYCLKQAGSNRGRYNAQGYSVVNDWDTVCSGTFDLKKLKRGDLLFYHVASRNKPIGHVAIYIGNGMIIDASSSNGKVVKRSCTTHWFTSNFRLAKSPW